MNKYGKCVCGNNLYPCWFEEQESKVEGGRLIWTNRYRKACSHLECRECFKNYVVDDSFDGAWYEVKR